MRLCVCAPAKTALCIADVKAEKCALWIWMEVEAVMRSWRAKSYDVARFALAEQALAGAWRQAIQPRLSGILEPSRERYR